MVYVALPELGIEGEWSISDPERLLAARILPTLPTPPKPGADAKTRWDNVQNTLLTVMAAIRDSGPLLFDGRPSVTERDGVTEMIGWVFAISQLHHEIGDGFQLYQGAAANEYLEGWTERLEPEVEELRRLLVTAAIP